MIKVVFPHFLLTIAAILLIGCNEEDENNLQDPFSTAQEKISTEDTISNVNFSTKNPKRLLIGTQQGQTQVLKLGDENKVYSVIAGENIIAGEYQCSAFFNSNDCSKYTIKANLVFPRREILKDIYNPDTDETLSTKITIDKFDTSIDFEVNIEEKSVSLNRDGIRTEFGNALLYKIEFNNSKSQLLKYLSYTSETVGPESKIILKDTTLENFIIYSKHPDHLRSYFDKEEKLPLIYRYDNGVISAWDTTKDFITDNNNENSSSLGEPGFIWEIN